MNTESCSEVGLPEIHSSSCFLSSPSSRVILCSMAAPIICVREMINDYYIVLQGLWGLQLHMRSGRLYSLVELN